MTAFVLGNGVSRQHIDPNILHTHGPVYGCNALYRSFIPHVLVATDTQIARKIQESGYSQKHKFYTRRPLNRLGALTVPKQYFGYSSGPVATALAAADQHHPIYLLGFDMGPNSDGKFNNLYAGTEFYKDIGAAPTYTGNWVKQLTKIMQDHPKQHFVRVMGDTSTVITDFDDIRNFSSMPIQQFEECINNGRGF